MKQYLTPLSTEFSGEGITLKALSAALLVGVTGVFTPALAQDEFDLPIIIVFQKVSNGVSAVQIILRILL